MGDTHSGAVLRTTMPAIRSSWRPAACSGTSASWLPQEDAGLAADPWPCRAAMRGFALRSLFGLSRPSDMDGAHSWAVMRTLTLAVRARLIAPLTACGDVPASCPAPEDADLAADPWPCRAAMRGFALRSIFGLSRPSDMDGDHSWAVLRATTPSGHPGARLLAAMLPRLVIRWRMRNLPLTPWPCRTAMQGFALRGLFGLGPTSDMGGAHSRAVMRMATPVVWARLIAPLTA